MPTVYRETIYQPYDTTRAFREGLTLRALLHKHEIKEYDFERMAYVLVIETFRRDAFGYTENDGYEHRRTMEFVAAHSDSEAIRIAIAAIDKEKTMFPRYDDVDENKVTRELARRAALATEEEAAEQRRRDRLATVNGTRPQARA